MDVQVDPSALALGVEQFSRWRERVGAAVSDYSKWFADAGMLDAQSEKVLKNLFERLDEERLSIAFVAEYSRGKSELINALFFADLDDRIVPSSAGRTTMCPTEFLWDGHSMPSIRLLPIETRKQDKTLSEFRNQLDAWQVFEFDPTEAASIKAAVQKVCETRLAPIEEAHALGLPARAEDLRSTLNVVEIPRWRHAIVNYPHPLFLQGLRVIDTPGLNAIGSEPELTHSLLPSANALVFVLGIDTGVTQSDMEIWEQHTRPEQIRYALLNKIDGLWDDIRSDGQINDEIDRQVNSVSHQLGLRLNHVFPISAQKALAGRLKVDSNLVAKSRIQAFEQALAQELLPRRYQIMSEQTGQRFGQIVHDHRWRLSEEQRSIAEQVHELNSLRGKNRSSIQQTASRIRSERQDFEAGLRLMHGLRVAHKRQAKKAFDLVSVDNLKRHVRSVRESIRASHLSTTLQSSMRQMIDASRADLLAADLQFQELHSMMNGLHKTFHTQFGMSLPKPTGFSLQQKISEIDRLNEVFDRQFGALSLLTNEKWVLTRKFFESIALELKKIYLAALTDGSTWVNSLLVPIESQLKLQQSQLSARMETVKRVLEASDQLDQSLSQLNMQNELLEEHLTQIGHLASKVHGALVTR